MTFRSDCRTVEAGKELRNDDESLRVPRGRAAHRSGPRSVLRYAHRGDSGGCDAVRRRDRRVAPAGDHGPVPDARSGGHLRAPRLVGDALTGETPSGVVAPERAMPSLG